MEPGKPKVPPIMMAVMGTLLCCSFALLIWAKLRMVTGTPRTAYADPKSGQAERDDSAQSDESIAQPPPIRAPNRPADPQASVEKSQQQALDAVPVEDSGSGGY